MKKSLWELRPNDLKFREKVPGPWFDELENNAVFRATLLRKRRGRRPWNDNYTDEPVMNIGIRWRIDRDIVRDLIQSSTPARDWIIAAWGTEHSKKKSKSNWFLIIRCAAAYALFGLIIAEAARQGFGLLLALAFLLYVGFEMWSATEGYWGHSFRAGMQIRGIANDGTRIWATGIFVSVLVLDFLICSLAGSRIPPAAIVFLSLLMALLMVHIMEWDIRRGIEASISAAAEELDFALRHILEGPMEEDDFEIPGPQGPLNAADVSAGAKAEKPPTAAV